MTEPDDNLEMLLKQHLRNSTPYIDDDGFSQNLIKRLPPKPMVSFRQIGLIIACLGVLLAGVFAGPVLLAPVFYWAAGLTVLGLFKIGLVMGVFILIATTAWMARELDWL